MRCGTVPNSRERNANTSLNDGESNKEGPLDSNSNPYKDNSLFKMREDTDEQEKEGSLGGE